MFLSERCQAKCQDFSGVYVWITVQWISQVKMRCPITWHSLYYKYTILKWAKCQCSSMSRWSVIYYGVHHFTCSIMIANQSMQMNDESYWMMLSVNMMTEEMWQRWTSSCHLAARLWWSPTTVVYQHHRTEGVVLPGMAHSTTSGCVLAECNVT